MEKEIILIFSEIEYEIQNVTYEYNEDEDDYPFCVSAQVFVPEHQGVLTATFNIDYILDTAEKHNAGMVRYVRTMIDSYKEESFWDRLAFEALEDEGFDLKQLIDYSVRELEIKIVENEE